MRIFEDWEKLRRRHFIQVWSMIYAARSKDGPDNWAYEQMNDVIRRIVDRWSENGMTKP